MAIDINGYKYYRTNEICKEVGISRSTLFRWLNKCELGQIKRDRRGWRIFNCEDIIRIKNEAGKIIVD